MTKTEARQFIVEASHPRLIGNAVFSSFSTSQDDAFQNIRRFLGTVKEGNPLTPEMIELMTLKVLAVQSKEDVSSLKPGAIHAWTYS